MGVGVGGGGAMTLELDQEDYEALGGPNADEFDLAFALETRVAYLADLRRPIKRKPKTASQKFIDAYKKRLAYVPRPRKPRLEPWEKRNPEKNAERKLAWYYAHRAQVRKYQQAEWRAKNPNYMKDYAAKRRREKRP